MLSDRFVCDAKAAICIFSTPLSTAISCSRPFSSSCGVYAFAPGVSSGLNLVGCIAPLAMSAGWISARSDRWPKPPWPLPSCIVTLNDAFATLLSVRYTLSWSYSPGSVHAWVWV